MKTNLIVKYALSILAATLMTSCEGFSDANDSEETSPLDVNVSLNIYVDNLNGIKDLKVSLDNYSEGIHYEKDVDDTHVVHLSGVVPGIYTVSASGMAYDVDGTEYYVNGNIVNKPLHSGTGNLQVEVQGLKVSPLIFKEIYFCGSEGWYFRDQFYEIYNNSTETEYLDGLYFASLYPTNATRILPVWHRDDNGKYVYGERVWKFPGTGHDYPLQPGESAVISQFAANHKMDIYNPNSPVDCSHSEFEFNMNNPRFPDQPALDMVHVFYNGKQEMGYMPQYLTPVFGGAFVIFRVPEGETWNPIDDMSLQNYEEGEEDDVKACIPIHYVLDAVECGDNESKVDAKRVPAVLDAGITWVGATYCGLGVSRRLLIQNGDTLRRDDGALIFQDTNNSTSDFVRGVVPVLHRYDTGVPSWNVTF
ncbi:MAG: DUF4876 domain-containing protein [Bacteroidaceae bacterium]|nr:DUF4876 domain-containing protein [Bacteroidaceae bacterium]